MGGSCTSFSSWKAAEEFTSDRQGSSGVGGNLKYDTGYVLKPGRPGQKSLVLDLRPRAAPLAPAEHPAGVS